ncbi:heme utilization cystosolic carrier protein HutX [uncultured Endozoicomonas sp.]|uniref:heme utilization cystosolic carrier protein HutX n=1 Tax=uncultured Endozoicomonas sp. TaxID=432652 RepID=UPI00260857FB|nr:heme utilization cystosolic carrier protein HutX [uncultured Endozoicomonas sp.]
MTLVKQIQDILSENPAILPAEMAKQLNVSELAVIQAMPADLVTLIDARHYLDVLRDIKTWGELTLVIDVDGSIFEMVGHLPKGGEKFGYYNLSDKRSPLKGHLKVDNVETIALVSKPFHGVDTRSVQFLSKTGRMLFKVYLRRDKEKNFFPEQLEKFEALKQLAVA